MRNEEIVNRLFESRDLPYADFQSRLTPNVDRSRFIGVRTPALRAFARELYKSGDHGDFLSSLPHFYFEENQLHAFWISLIKDYEKCMERTREFLPYIDNWATCDQLTPKVFCKHKGELLGEIKVWLKSDLTYTVRFGIGMLMRHFLDDDFTREYPRLVASVRSEEYYVNMMIAWYFATALAKQYESALPLIEDRALEPWTHNKAIQKAIESFRVLPEHKEYLKKLRV